MEQRVGREALRDVAAKAIGVLGGAQGIRRCHAAGDERSLDLFWVQRGEVARAPRLAVEPRRVRAEDRLHRRLVAVHQVVRRDCESDAVRVGSREIAALDELGDELVADLGHGACVPEDRRRCLCRYARQADRGVQDVALVAGDCIEARFERRLELGRDDAVRDRRATGRAQRGRRLSEELVQVVRLALAEPAVEQGGWDL